MLARGGVLADEMGLGKTITALALMVSDKQQQHAPTDLPSRRPTLIVCPLSVISNWEEQIEEHVGMIEKDGPPGTLPQGLKVGLIHRST